MFVLSILKSCQLHNSKPYLLLFTDQHWLHQSLPLFSLHCEYTAIFPLHICFSVNDASSRGITIYCTGQHFRPLFYPPHKSFLHFCKSKFGCLLSGLDLLSASNSCTELRSPSYSATELDPTLSPTYSPSYISSTS